MSSVSESGSKVRAATSMEEGRERGTMKMTRSVPAVFLGKRAIPVWLLIFAIALLIRLMQLAMGQQWPLTPTSRFWNGGYEIVHIATSIASHRGFSSPFSMQSGPTAWIPPVYPYFVASVFSVLGIRSNAAAITILSMQALFSALVCIPLYWIGKQAFDERTARLASWSWALFPYAVVMPVWFVWETSLSALLLVLLCLLCMKLPDAGLGRLLGVGALWGVAALTNTALLALMPFFIVWPYQRSSRTTAIKSLFITGVVCCVVITPWAIRNWRTFGVLLPVRSNFGEELWLGNHDGGTGRTQFGLGPAENQGEEQRYVQMGEIAYNAQRKAAAFAFISHHPGLFLKGVFYRVRYWWWGVGETAPAFYMYRFLTLFAGAGIIIVWWTGAPGAGLPIIALVVYPLVYYLTDVYARYRYPMEPLMILLGAFAASQLFAELKRRVRS